MKLPSHKTKIVATIGLTSESPAVMQQMIEPGMNIAGLSPDTRRPARNPVAG